MLRISTILWGTWLFVRSPSELDFVAAKINPVGTSGRLRIVYSLEENRYLRQTPRSQNVSDLVGLREL